MSLSLHPFLSSSLLSSHHHSISLLPQASAPPSTFLPLHFCLYRNIWFVHHEVGCLPYLPADCFCPLLHHLVILFPLLFSLHLVCCWSHASPQGKTLLSSLCSSHLYSSPIFLLPLSSPHTSARPDYSPVSSS